MPTLADYLTKSRRLLKDDGVLYSDSDLTAAINEARHQRDLDTRLVRAVYGFSLTVNQSTYSLATVKASGTFIRGESSLTPRDLLSFFLIPQGAAGGVGVRIPVGRWPYSILGYLASTSWPGYPRGFAFMGPGTVVLAPPPAQAYPAEWDLVGIYPDLVATTDADPMLDPWNDPLPYLAASIAKLNAQRYDEAAAFEQTYEKRLRRLREGARPIALPTPWMGLPRR